MTARQGTIRRRAVRAVNAADWIDRDGTDAVAVGLVYALADQVDLATRPPSDDALFDDTKVREAAGKVAFVAQVLLKSLDALGLTPTARTRFVDDDADSGADLVADLRAIMTG